MASIRKDILLDASPGDVWDAVRDFGALHTRLVPGFVRDTRLEGPDVRIVSFANGNVVRELLVDCDDPRKRLVYAASSERIQHYNASVQVLAEGEARSRLVWIIDLLPGDIAPYIAGQMDQAALAMQQVFGGST
jgi:Polyketide cyclase / dehydrase and lipid transport